MSTHMPGFQSFSSFLHHFVLTKLATSSQSVNTFNAESTFVKNTRTKRIVSHLNRVVLVSIGSLSLNTVNHSSIAGTIIER